MMRAEQTRSLPSRETLLELLSYAPETGDLLWKAKPAASLSNKCFNTKYAGKPAGSLSGGRTDGSNRYLLVGIRLDGKYQQYLAHRLIWKMMTGEEPPIQIDHRDGNELNNKWDNLRPATNGKNIQNSKLRKDNTSGVKGVCWDNDRNQWLAVIAVNKRHLKVGRFNRIEEAAAAIENKRRELHGEFARNR